VKDAAPPLFERVRRKLRGLKLRTTLNDYLEAMPPAHPLHGIPARVVGDASADPSEFFDHYDAYAFWVASRLGSKRHRILDLGSPKMQNAMLSAYNDVTAIVLADCSDYFSNIEYCRHDAGTPLPFEARSFDCFTSTVAIPLMGLGRYGDRVDPNAVQTLIAELNRVLNVDAELLVSLTTGPNFLAFNNGWYLDLTTIERLFVGWELYDVVIDTWSSPRDGPRPAVKDRFAGRSAVPDIAMGDYRVVFCAFRRAATK
jgi:hypothetical protein